MTTPLVSVITPTWRRHGLLLNRCIPAVEQQTYKAVEHMIVSDGPDPELMAWFLRPRVEGRRSCWYLELLEHSPDEHWGHEARLYGIRYSSGQLITYCDDDDALRPEHCALLATALEDDPGAGFAVSRMKSSSPHGDHEYGGGPPSLGDFGTPMMMHRREILEYGNWGPAGFSEDWELVNRWLHAGVRYVQVDAVTSDVWPSAFRGEGPS